MFRGLSQWRHAIPRQRSRRLRDQIVRVGLMIALLGTSAANSTAHPAPARTAPTVSSERAQQRATLPVGMPGGNNRADLDATASVGPHADASLTSDILVPGWSSAETDDTTNVAWGDVDNDGDLDLAVGNYGAPNRLYRNEGGSLSVSPVWSWYLPFLSA